MIPYFSIWIVLRKSGLFPNIRPFSTTEIRPQLRPPDQKWQRMFLPLVYFPASHIQTTDSTSDVCIYSSETSFLFELFSLQDPRLTSTATSHSTPQPSPAPSAPLSATNKASQSGSPASQPPANPPSPSNSSTNSSVPAAYTPTASMATTSVSDSTRT